MISKIMLNYLSQFMNIIITTNNKPMKQTIIAAEDWLTTFYYLISSELTKAEIDRHLLDISIDHNQTRGQSFEQFEDTLNELESTWLISIEKCNILKLKIN